MKKYVFTICEDDNLKLKWRRVEVGNLVEEVYQTQSKAAPRVGMGIAEGQ